MVSAIILASGYSKRMGRDKLLLKYRGKTLIQHTIDTILKYEFLEVILVGREEEIIQIGNKNGIKVIKNDNAVKGISESIKLGVMQAMKTNGFMFFTADQPFLDIDIIKKLVYKFIENLDCIIVPQFEGRRGNPVIFPYNLKEDFLKLQGDVGGKTIINKYFNKVKFVEINDGTKLFDIDTNANYEYILKLKGDDDNF